MSNILLSQRIGCQTIVFGRRFSDVATFQKSMELVSALGFNGVEISQPISGLPFSDGNQLNNELKRYNLKLIGLSGGTLYDRVKFLQGVPVDYLYQDQHDPAAVRWAQGHNYVVALHPYVFGAFETVGDCNDELAENDKLRVVLDTAHAHVAGDSISDRIRHLTDRVSAVHLKDWTPTYGASSHRYARGFCSLGEGDVKLESAIAAIRKAAFAGWVIWELDAPNGTARESAITSANWLSIKKLLPPVASQSRAFSVVFRSDSDYGTPKKWSRLLRIPAGPLLQGCASKALCYQAIPDAIKKGTSAVLVELWANNPSHSRLSLLGSTEATGHTVWDASWDDATCRAAIQSQRVVQLKLQQNEGADQKLRSKLNLKHMASVPVFDRYNPHSIHYVVNIFPETPFSRDVLRSLEDESELWAMSLWSAFDADCTAVSLHGDERASRWRSSDQYMADAAELIAEAANADVTVLVLPENQAALRHGRYTSFACARSPHGTRQQSQQDSVYICPNGYFDDLLTRARRVLFEGNVSTCISGSNVECQGYGMALPLVYGNRLLGMVACLRKARKGSHSWFTEDEAGECDSLVSTVSRNLETFLAKERMDATRRNLKHSINQPLFEVRGLLSAISAYKPLRNSLREDYVGDIESWVSLAARVLSDPSEDLAGWASIPLSQSRTLLMSGVVAAVVRQVDELLKERSFPKGAITYSGLSRIPELYIDKNRFQQVYLNLITNSIKYAHNDPSAFRIEIDGEYHGESVILNIRDWGIGIDKQHFENVFAEGFRVNSSSPTILGDGLGLAFVKTIVTAHGGFVRIIDSPYPTAVQITLPKSTVVRRKRPERRKRF